MYDYNAPLGLNKLHFLVMHLEKSKSVYNSSPPGGAITANFGFAFCFVDRVVFTSTAACSLHIISSVFQSASALSTPVVGDILPDVPIWW